MVSFGPLGVPLSQNPLLCTSSLEHPGPGGRRTTADLVSEVHRLSRGRTHVSDGMPPLGIHSHPQDEIGKRQIRDQLPVGDEEANPILVSG